MTEILHIESLNKYDAYAATLGAIAAYATTTSLMVGEEPVSSRIIFKTEQFFVDTYSIGRVKPIIAEPSNKPQPVASYEAVQIGEATLLGAAALAVASWYVRRKLFDRKVSKLTKQFSQEMDIELQFIDHLK